MAEDVAKETPERSKRVHRNLARVSYTYSFIMFSHLSIRNVHISSVQTSNCLNHLLIFPSAWTMGFPSVWN